MYGELTNDEIRDLISVATQAARKVSADPEVAAEAAHFAVMQLRGVAEAIVPAARKAWVRTTAKHQAMRVGKKLHRELPMGRQGSEPPWKPRVRGGDLEEDDEAAHDWWEGHVKSVLTEMHHGGGSLGSRVAMKVDFEKCWAMLSEDARSLLKDKYVYGMRSKEMAEERGESPGVIDNKLMAARRAAQPLLQDLLDDPPGDG